MAVETADDVFPRYAFIDGCEANQELNKEFKYYDTDMKDALKIGVFPSLNCDNQQIDNEDDESQWNDLPTVNRYFKCARLINKDRTERMCKTYAVIFLHFV